ncbi:hypothetical protein HDU79_010724 [Rhizoclosmatium sp. JEL0117]|nr:hypothetical protein HDU79_010724 [Rhizoclosmatium sp. JEL0117]
MAGSQVATFAPKQARRPVPQRRTRAQTPPLTLVSRRTSKASFSSFYTASSTGSSYRRQRVSLTKAFPPRYHDIETGDELYDSDSYHEEGGDEHSVATSRTPSFSSRRSSTSSFRKSLQSLLQSYNSRISDGDIVVQLNSQGLDTIQEDGEDDVSELTAVNLEGLKRRPSTPFVEGNARHGYPRKGTAIPVSEDSFDEVSGELKRSTPQRRNLTRKKSSINLKKLSRLSYSLPFDQDSQTKKPFRSSVLHRLDFLLNQLDDELQQISEESQESDWADETTSSSATLSTFTLEYSTPQRKTTGGFRVLNEDSKSTSSSDTLIEEKKVRRVSIVLPEEGTKEKRRIVSMLRSTLQWYQSSPVGKLTTVQTSSKDNSSETLVTSTAKHIGSFWGSTTTLSDTSSSTPPSPSVISCVAPTSPSPPIVSSTPQATARTQSARSTIEASKEARRLRMERMKINTSAVAVASPDKSINSVFSPTGTH